MIVECKQCNKRFDKQPSQIKEGSNNFCSRSCAATYNNSKFPKRKQLKKYCLYCGNIIKGNAKKYCSNKCQSKQKYQDYINKQKNGKVSGISGKNGTSKFIKRYLINEYGEKCMLCGQNKKNTFTNKIPIELHHIDGNFKNNVKDNLQLLCPCCHSLTSTYKNGNKLSNRNRYS